MTVSKSAKLTIVITLLLALSVAPIIAGSKGSISVQLASAASLAGKQMKPGAYKIAWQTHSPEATVTIYRGSKLIVETRGKFVERDVKSIYDSVVTRTGADGQDVITEVRFQGKKQVLVLEQ